METNTAAHRLPAALTFPLALLVIVAGGALTGLVVGGVGSICYLAFIYPIVMGVAGGKLVTAVTRWTGIRNVRQMVLLAVLAAVVIYGSQHYGRYLTLLAQASLEYFNNIDLPVARILVDLAIEGETGYTGFLGYMLLRAQEGLSIGRFYSDSGLALGPLLTWLYWALEFGGILAIAVYMGKNQPVVPACETCGKPFGREKHLGGTAPANESLLLDLLRRNDVAELAQLIEKDAGLPSLELYMQRCESCGESSARMTVRRVTPGRGGSLQFSDLSKAVLPPGESGLFLKQLRFEVE
jgi:hypothetical protein